MIPMQRARQLVQKMPTARKMVGGGGMDAGTDSTPQGLGGAPQSPAPIGGMVGGMTGGMAVSGKPAAINATPAIQGQLSPGVAPPAGEVPGKPAAPPIALNPSGGMPGQVNAPTAPANVSTTQAGSLPPAPGSITPPPPATPPASPNVPYANVTPITPGADLRGQQIAPGANADRLGMAEGAFNDYLTQKLPEFQAALRKSYQGNAALGRLGSGMLRTDVGNLDLAAERDANLTKSGLIRDATDRSITDQSNYRNELRGERGYQNELEDQAFNRSRQGIFDADALQNSQFGRDVTKTQLGYQGNPSSILSELAALRGQGAANGAAAVGGLTQQTGYLDILKKILASQKTPGASPGYGTNEASGAFQ